MRFPLTVISVLAMASGMFLGAGVAHTQTTRYVDDDNCQLNEAAKLVASDAQIRDKFGVAVSISQNVAVSGAFSNDEAGMNAGAGYVYRFDGTDWIEEAKLTASDAETRDEFGIAVAIDENVVVIGARNEGNTGGTNNDYGHGAAYVYRFDGTHWNEEAKFIASDALPGDRFGISVSVSGNVAVIGNHALFSDDLGSAHVYRFDGTDWIEEAVLTASDQAVNDKYAFSVSVCADVIAVGAWNDDDGASDSGSVYVYRFDPGTSEWIEEAKLTASDPGTNDYFGLAVSVSGDVIAIGALGDAESGYQSGAAYVFRFNPGAPGDWDEEAKLTRVPAAEYEFFGGTVSISGDVVVIGAYNDGNTGYPNNDGPGAAYAYRFDGANWVGEARLTASEAPPGEGFGRSVSITGSVAMAGALRNDDAGLDSGAAYVFELSEFCGEPLVGNLDIKPGSCPNPFNRHGNGVLPVALVGTSELDPTEVDLSTLQLSRADGVGGSVGPNQGPPGPHSVFEDVASPFEGEACECQDLGGDGIDDLSMKFRTDEMVEALELDALPGGAVVELVLSGSLLDGTPFAARDCIVILPPGDTSPANAQVQSNVADTFVEVAPLDLNFDTAGFADFSRSYYGGTAMTLTAPPHSAGRRFVRWLVEGAPQPIGMRTIEVIVSEATTLKAVYARPARPTPEHPTESDDPLE